MSRPSVLPATTITWFQADVACRASGKRLPTNAEWTIAGRGTPDPGNSLGEDGKCRTGGGIMRLTGQGKACVSQWGAEDMIGNAAEIVAEWAAAPSMSLTDPNNGLPGPANWGASFAGDTATHVTSIAGNPAPVGWVVGVPAAVLRGGGNWEGTGAGVFNMNLSVAAGGSHGATGFRCVIPR
jgi:formylglycine-generating enzyme required for sulfatase activity